MFVKKCNYGFFRWYLSLISLISLFVVKINIIFVFEAIKNKFISVFKLYVKNKSYISFPLLGARFRIYKCIIIFSFVF